MAANGREFTSDVNLLSHLRFPIDVAGKQDCRLILRGQSFEADEPFLFEMIDLLPASLEYWEARSDVGFRVAVEPGEGRTE
jgi:hypothetical protein